MTQHPKGAELWAELMMAVRAEQKARSPGAVYDRARIDSTRSHLLEMRDRIIALIDDPVRAAGPELLAAARPFDLADWLSSGVLTCTRTDTLRINLSITGTDYEAIVTVGELRALHAAIAKATGESK